MLQFYRLILIIGLICAVYADSEDNENKSYDVILPNSGVPECPTGWRYNYTAKACDLIKPVDKKTRPFTHLTCPPGWHFDALNGCYVPGYIPPTTYRPTTKPPPPTCGSYQYGTPPNCIWKPCPPGYIGDRYPNCKLIEVPRCPFGQTGTPPNCKPIPTCPPGMKGVPPHCHNCELYRECYC